MRVGARSSIALRGFDPAPSTVSHSRFAGAPRDGDGMSGAARAQDAARRPPGGV